MIANFQQCRTSRVQKSHAEKKNKNIHTKKEQGFLREKAEKNNQGPCPVRELVRVQHQHLG